MGLERDKKNAKDRAKGGVAPRNSEALVIPKLTKEQQRYFREILENERSSKPDRVLGGPRRPNAR
jgi:hypothetical protein